MTTADLLFGTGSGLLIGVLWFCAGWKAGCWHTTKKIKDKMLSAHEDFMERMRSAQGPEPENVTHDRAIVMMARDGIMIERNKMLRACRWFRQQTNITRGDLSKMLEMSAAEYECGRMSIEDAAKFEDRFYHRFRVEIRYIAFTQYTDCTTLGDGLKNYVESVVGQIREGIDRAVTAAKMSNDSWQEEDDE